MPKSETPPGPKGAAPKLVIPHSSPLGSTINQNTGTTPAGRGIGAYVDNALFPGLLRGEVQGAYTTWLSSLPKTSPDQWALIQAHGPAMQELLWRAYQDRQNPSDTLNEMTHMFGSSVFTAAGAPGAGGGGRRGGSGGAGVQPPTPEQIASAAAAIKNRAAVLGHTPFSDDEMTWIATTVVKDGWSPAQLDDFLTTGDQLTKITQPGDITASVDQIKAMATSQLTNVSDATAREWATRIASGEMNIATVGTIFQQQAQQEFGWAASSLQGGLTMRDILMPARDRIATELEKPAETIDLMDPRFRKMAQSTDANGLTKAASLTEVTRNARQDADWQHTASAARLAADVAQQLRTTFEG